MELSAKLQIKPGQRIATVAGSAAAPPIEATGCETARSPDEADVVIAFVRTRADLDTVAAPAVAAASADKLTWIAYPKAGKLGTDLNRDLLRDELAARGVQPVRQVAIDDVWSALRFRPV
jgi:hypothetical protein